jgi:hypothetical protein
VTAITGTVGGNAIAGLIPDFFGDNLVFPNSNGTSLLDTHGISFDDVLGQDYNVFGRSDADVGFIRVTQFNEQTITTRSQGGCCVER